MYRLCAWVFHSVTVLKCLMPSTNNYSLTIQLYIVAGHIQRNRVVIIFTEVVGLWISLKTLCLFVSLLLNGTSALISKVRDSSQGLKTRVRLK